MVPRSRRRRRDKGEGHHDIHRDDVTDRDDREALARAVPRAGTDDGSRVAKRVFFSDGSEEFWVAVETPHEESAVKWSAKVAPANPALTASFTATGTGPVTSGAYLLDKGNYTFTATYSDNVYYKGVPMPIDIFLPVYANSRVQDVVEIVPEVESEKGTVSGSFTLAQRSIVWLDAWAMDWAEWTVAVKGALTKTPTPKVTGTLAVGKTLYRGRGYVGADAREPDIPVVPGQHRDQGSDEEDLQAHRRGQRQDRQGEGHRREVRVHNGVEDIQGHRKGKGRDAHDGDAEDRRDREGRQEADGQGGHLGAGHREADLPVVPGFVEDQGRDEEGRLRILSGPAPFGRWARSVRLREEFREVQ